MCCCAVEGAVGETVMEVLLLLVLVTTVEVTAVALEVAVAEEAPTRSGRPARFDGGGADEGTNFLLFLVYFVACLLASFFFLQIKLCNSFRFFLVSYPTTKCGLLPCVAKFCCAFKYVHR